jgi:NADH-quinone oxidoreductase subunit L
VWLPDAMAGPTPVSALIHAATMVTSGVYLMVRVSPILAASYDWVPDVIAWTGAITALFAATIAVAQHDIKKVLAYSTISQLGYMFLAVGTGAYVAAIFHMVTHAFFKALLFLGSGSVIHGLHGEQDMRRMGGLRALMPVTAATFIVGWLAIAGVPPFAGFWSKDEILLFAWASGGAGYALWAVGLVTAALTAYYMSRQVVLVFFGEPRYGTEGEHAVHPHESPWSMTLPLVVLALLTVAGGVINLPLFGDTLFLEHWLEPVLEGTGAHLDEATGTKVGLAVVAAIAGVAGILLARRVYLERKLEPVEPEILGHGWYYDEAITSFMGGPGREAFEGAARFDAEVVDGAVNGTGAVVRDAGMVLRRVQSGFVRSYALGVAAGVVVVLGYFLTRVGF